MGNDRLVINIRPREILRVILSDFVLSPFLRMTRGWFPVGGVMLRTGVQRSLRGPYRSISPHCVKTPREILRVKSRSLVLLPFSE